MLEVSIFQGGTNMPSEATGDCGPAGEEAVFVIQGESRIAGV